MKGSPASAGPSRFIGNDESVKVTSSDSRHFVPDAELAAFVAAIPKTETHLHLEGSVSFAQLHEFDPERYAEPPPFWQPDFRYDGFAHFQAEFDHWVLPYHSSVARYQETARHVFAECLAQGCRYVETSFHLPAIDWIDGDGKDLVDAILDTAPEGLEVRLFGGMTHVDYLQHQNVLEQALTWDRLSGIDLHGPEDLPIDKELPDYWQRARDVGKVTKAHAGEFMPASFVEWVVDYLGVERVQHGVRAIESPTVVEFSISAPYPTSSWACRASMRCLCIRFDDWSTPASS
jgi:adenosine deaminase